MTYTCKHCGKPVPALTICNCRGALIEHYLEELDRHGWTGLKELTAENERLTNGSKSLLSKCNQLLNELRESDAIVVSHAEKLGRQAAEITRLTAELAECRQAAFENGRETERAAGYGELEY